MVSLEARLMTLREGERISMTVNGTPVITSHSRESLTTCPFPLRDGKNIVEFESLFEPNPPMEWDPRTLNIAWKGIIVKGVPGISEGL